MALACAVVRKEGSTALLTRSSTNMAICSSGLPVLNSCINSSKKRNSQVTAGAAAADVMHAGQIRLEC